MTTMVEEVSPHVFVTTHPLIQHKLSLLRQRDTENPVFRSLMGEIGLLMGYEMTRSLPAHPRPIQTPVTPCTGVSVRQTDVVIVSILRAGLGMAEGLTQLMPRAGQGHIGLYRDPATHRPVEYLVRLPARGDLTYILVDPMLATGHSAVHGIQVLHQHGAKTSNILFMSLVAAPEGIKTLRAAYPTIPLYTAAIDDGLNGDNYIVPGLGDAGDRLFGVMGHD